MAQSRATRHRGGWRGVQSPASLGPLAVLAVLAGAPLSLLVWRLPAAQVLPMFSLVALAAALAAALIAWRRGTRRDADGITLWDVAGMLAFFGFAAGMLSKPAHVAQLFGVATAAS